MDRYIGRIPIRTLGSGTRYDGRVWYELLSSIRSVNGTPVVQGQLERSMLNQGDRVTLEYQSKTYRGIVDVEASTNPNITECGIKSLELQPANSSCAAGRGEATEPPRQPEPDTDTELERKPQQAGIRASPRKRKYRVGQDTPPKKQAKRIVSKKAGTYIVHVHRLMYCRM